MNSSLPLSPVFAWRNYQDAIPNIVASRESLWDRKRVLQFILRSDLTHMVHPRRHFGSHCRPLAPLGGSISQGFRFNMTGSVAVFISTNRDETLQCMSLRSLDALSKRDSVRRGFARPETPAVHSKGR